MTTEGDNMTALADTSDPRFTDDQRATLARFEAAETPPEVLEAAALVEQSVDLTPGVVWTDAQLAVVRDLLARAVRAETAVRRVEALAAEWGADTDARYSQNRIAKSTAARVLREALATQATDGTQGIWLR